MNPEAENLNIIQANVCGPQPRDDSISSSTRNMSTINGALSAAESLPLDPKVCSTDGISDCHTPPQQSPPLKQLQFESSLERDSLKGIIIILLSMLNKLKSYQTELDNHHPPTKSLWNPIFVNKKLIATNIRL